jgi:hypothetical protein
MVRFMASGKSRHERIRSNLLALLDSTPTGHASPLVFQKKTSGPKTHSGRHYDRTHFRSTDLEPTTQAAQRLTHPSPGWLAPRYFTHWVNGSLVTLAKESSLKSYQVPSNVWRPAHKAGKVAEAREEIPPRNSNGLKQGGKGIADGPYPILLGCFAGTHQIPQGLGTFIRNPHRRQISRSVALCQLLCIPPIHLYPIACLDRHQRVRTISHSTTNPASCQYTT